MVLQCIQAPLNHLYPMHPNLSPVMSYVALHLGGGGVFLWILGVGSTGRHLHFPPQECSQGCHMTLCHHDILVQYSCGSGSFKVEGNMAGLRQPLLALSPPLGGDEVPTSQLLIVLLAVTVSIMVVNGSR